MFRGEDEDDNGENASQGVAIGKQMINKASIMGDIINRVANVQTGAPGATGDNTGGVNMEAEKSIKDIIEERQKQL